MPSPKKSASWQQLTEHAHAQQALSISSLFDADESRASDFCLDAVGIRLDYSKTHIDAAARALLLQLAEDSGLENKMLAMRAGEKINSSEDRAVLHIALRDLQGRFAVDYGQPIHDSVQEQLSRLKQLSEQVRNGEWLGYTGRRIRHVVNIGIGGSDLGPKMVCEALRDFQSSDLTVHFASNVDETHLPGLLRGLSAEETLFSISSKTFTTQETLCNAQQARRWLLAELKDQAAIARHCVAVTSNTAAAAEFGIPEQNLLRFWDWVGGRFSLWSSIGLPIALAAGFERFEQLLDGAHQMDRHFFESQFDSNLPVTLALCGVWHNNFCNKHSLGVIPYSDALNLMPAYLQQLDMESNGKSIDADGLPVDYATGPLVWGQTGSNGQHAFFQLLHQGTTIVPLEFIFALNPGTDESEQHRVLLANMLAQSNALMTGQAAETDKPYTLYEGDRPSISIALERLSPATLGSLIALYEHKIFVQGVIWNLNSFDQWGVQLGKRIASTIGTEFSKPNSKLDPSSNALLAWIHKRL